MNILAISDTHGAHKTLNLEEYSDCSVLVHTGDFTRSHIHHEDEALEFADWMEQQPFEHKIIVAGNHDFYPYHYPGRFKYICDKRNIYYLQDSSVTINGVNFYGSPWTPPFYDWAFMKSELELEEIFSNISKDTDVLLTHGPAFGALDLTHTNISVGSYSLLEAMDTLNLKAHVFGHIHHSYGQQGISTNCAIMTEGYRPTNKPIKVIINEYKT